MPGHEPDLLLIENINENQQQTFSLISIERQKILKTISLDPTYAGVVAKSYSKDRIVLTQYTHQNNPDQTHIFVFDWSKKDPLLRFENTRILQVGVDWIQLPHPHFESKDVYIDLHTGIECPPPSATTNSSDIYYATAYPSSSEYFQWFEQYFSTHGIVPFRQIEYLKTHDRILISFYEERNNGLKHSLIILDTKGRLLEHILLEDHLTGIGKDTFFVLHHTAIFITHKYTLNFYVL